MFFMNLKHFNVINNSKGHRTSNRFKISVNVLNRSKSYSHIHIRSHNRFFSKLWIRSINSHCKSYGYNYSQLPNSSRFSNILDKKSFYSMLSSDVDFFNRFLELPNGSLKFIEFNSNGLQKFSLNGKSEIIKIVKDAYNITN